MAGRDKPDHDKFWGFSRLESLVKGWPNRREIFSRLMGEVAEPRREFIQAIASRVIAHKSS